MTNASYIADTPLPVNQDFTALKGLGLAYIQQYGGTEWTNLNASDPGVTILDQLCYALTELGYCNDFPVADILAGPGDKLKIADQFYLPEKILTTSPVTIDDYRKYIIDGVDGVNNAIIISYPNAAFNIYKVYLLIDEKAADPAAVCRAAFLYLNKCRSLGELFLMPEGFVALQPDPWLLYGTIELDDRNSYTGFLTALNLLIRNYIFPEFSPEGYGQLIAEGFATGDIFNGPLLKNGWLPGKLAGDKKNTLRVTDLESIIRSVAGVVGISLSGFGRAIAPVQGQAQPGTPTPGNLAGPVITEVSSGTEQVITIDIALSLANSLTIKAKGTSLYANAASGAAVNPQFKGLQGFGGNIHPGASVQVQTSLPEATYRDINSYYSIQNTFPEIFAVGTDAITSNASAFQIAQSRQLKGYLTLFDQVLANQFSQLANIDKLFSFKNTLSGSPSDESGFYAVKNEFEKNNLQYPVPYLSFSPTYFYQSLYDVPHIMPLLKDNDTFGFSMELESRKEMEQKSWTEYKQDPYNPYMAGLMEFMEDEKINLQRRNDILDHLLARHGESPVLINSIIEGSKYAGGSLKDAVIFKSLFLQNLGLLSYYRQKGCNFTAANKISGVVVPDDEPKIDGNHSTDFIFNACKVDHIEKLTESDFINYSALELKLNLLFGLKVFYRDYIEFLKEHITIANQQESNDQISVAMWMIGQRKGCILLETGLLMQAMQDAPALITITTDAVHGPWWQISERNNFNGRVVFTQRLSCRTGKDVEQSLYSDTGNLATQISNGYLTIGEFSYPIPGISGFSLPLNSYKAIPGTPYYVAVSISIAGETGALKNIAVPDNRIEMIFQDFSLQPLVNDSDAQLNIPGFENRLKLLLQNELPVQMPYQYHFINYTHLNSSIIPAFVKWHNCLLYDENGERNESELASGAGNLIFQLSENSIF